MVFPKRRPVGNLRRPEVFSGAKWDVWVEIIRGTWAVCVYTARIRPYEGNKERL